MHERLIKMAGDMGLPFVESDFRPNSRRALEATEYAREHGKHEEFHHRVIAMLWGQNANISDWKVLKAAAEEVGLDADEMQREVDAGKYAAELDAQIVKSQVLNIRAVPTYIINDKYMLTGAQPYEEFKKVIEQLEQ